MHPDNGDGSAGVNEARKASVRTDVAQRVVEHGHSNQWARKRRSGNRRVRDHGASPLHEVRDGIAMRSQSCYA